MAHVVLFLFFLFIIIFFNSVGIIICNILGRFDEILIRGSEASLLVLFHSFIYSSLLGVGSNSFTVDAMMRGLAVSSVNVGCFVICQLQPEELAWGLSQKLC